MELSDLLHYGDGEDPGDLGKWRAAVQVLAGTEDLESPLHRLKGQSHLLERIVCDAVAVTGLKHTMGMLSPWSEQERSDLLRGYSLLYRKLRHHFGLLESESVAAVATVPVGYDDDKRQLVKKVFHQCEGTCLRVINDKTSLLIGLGLDLDPEGGAYDERFYCTVEVAPHDVSVGILSIEEGIFEVITSAHFETHTAGEEEPPDVEAVWCRVQHEVGTSPRLVKGFQSLQAIIVHSTEEMAGPAFEHIQEHAGRQGVKAILCDGYAVTKGAAIQAQIMTVPASSAHVLCGLHFTTLNLGVETAPNGAMHWIVTRGCTIPCRKSTIFTTHMDGQSNVMINVYEGLRPQSEYSDLLHQLELPIWPAPKGIVQLEVVMNIDANDVFSVTARVLGHEGGVAVTWVARLQEGQNVLHQRPVAHTRMLEDDQETYRDADAAYQADFGSDRCQVSGLPMLPGQASLMLPAPQRTC